MPSHDEDSLVRVARACEHIAELLVNIEELLRQCMDTERDALTKNVKWRSLRILNIDD